MERVASIAAHCVPRKAKCAAALCTSAKYSYDCQRRRMQVAGEHPLPVHSAPKRSQSSLTSGHCGGGCGGRVAAEARRLAANLLLPIIFFFSDQNQYKRLHHHSRQCRVSVGGGGKLRLRLLV